MTNGATEDCSKTFLKKEEKVELEDMFCTLNLERAKLNLITAKLSKKYKLSKNVGFSDDGFFYVGEERIKEKKMTTDELNSVVELSRELDKINAEISVRLAELKNLYKMPSCSTLEQEEWYWILPSKKVAVAYK